MKRVTQPPRRKKKRYTPIITIIAAMVFITIVIVLICVFTIKPNSQETVATPESITSEITSNQSEPGETIPPADSSSNASSRALISLDTSGTVLSCSTILSSLSRSLIAKKRFCSSGT